MLDLTPAEVVRLVQIVKALDDDNAIINERGELAMLHLDEHTLSLAEKIGAEGSREDVKAYIEEFYEAIDEEEDKE